MVTIFNDKKHRIDILGLNMVDAIILEKLLVDALEKKKYSAGTQIIANNFLQLLDSMMQQACEIVWDKEISSEKEQP